LTGSNFYKAKNSASHIKQFKTFDDLKEVIKTQELENATVLIKASRGMALERILDLL